MILAICAISCKRHVDNRAETNGAANSSTTATSDTDTLHILRLSSALYKNLDYQIQEVYYIDKNTRCIEIARNERLIKTIKLPNCQDVKNFSVNTIVQTKEGFKITVNWGGGQYFYARNFLFAYNDGTFYLTCVGKSHYAVDSDKDKQTNERMSPPVPLDEFDISKYLSNE